MRGEAVWAAAQQWIGTPFHEQQSAKGQGCDCKGLLWGVARELGFPEAESFYAKFIDYDLGQKGGIPTALLKEGMGSLFDRADDFQTGDILLLRHVRQAVHLAIVGPNDRAIHAAIGPSNMVKDTSLSRVLLKVYTLDSIWRWRDGR